MYLANMHIQNYTGIKYLEVEFDPSINIIIGENGCGKSALIDAIRLLYNLGEQRRDIFVSDEDFHVDIETGQITDTFTISYQFRGLTDKQKGALYEYMVAVDNPDDDHVKITVVYEQRDTKGPKFSYYTGKNEGQKADPNTFELFQHYYFGALKDSTKHLLRSRKNILGELIHRGILEKGRSEDIAAIVSDANHDLLKQDEVTEARNNINDNLSASFPLARFFSIIRCAAANRKDAQHN